MLWKLSHNVNIISLAATATRTSPEQICHVLGMSKLVVVAEWPNKTKLKYSIMPKLSMIKETFDPLMEEVWLKRANVDKTIIFCQPYNCVVGIYGFFKSRLGKAKTEPPGLSDLACFYQPAARKVRGRLVLRLLYCFRVCIYMCASALITCTIITSRTLLPCDLTLVNFGNLDGCFA